MEEKNERTKKSPSTLTEGNDYLPTHAYELTDNTFRFIKNKLEEAKESSSGGRGSRTSGPEKRNNPSTLVSGESGSRYVYKMQWTLVNDILDRGY